MKDVMLDIETLDTRVGGVITSIGAVEFDIHTGELGRDFYATIDARKAEAEGFTLRADTVLWWMQQELAARKELYAPERPQVSTKKALNRLAAFWPGNARFWSHATFDFVMVSHAYQHLGIKMPYSFRVGMDIRTLLTLTKDKDQKAFESEICDTSRVGIAHNALDDAKSQVKHVCSCYKVLMR